MPALWLDGASGMTPAKSALPVRRMLRGDIEISVLNGYLRLCARDDDVIEAELTVEDLAALGFSAEAAAIERIEHGDFGLWWDKGVLIIAAYDYRPVPTTIAPAILHLLGLACVPRKA